MKNKMKIVSLILVMFLSVTVMGTTIAYAADDTQIVEEILYESDEVIPGTSDDKDYAEDIYMSMLRGTYFNSGTSTIRANGDGTITISGTTAANGSVGYVYVDVNLQRWTGSTWITVATVSKSASNTSSAYKSAVVTINKGSSYRTLSTHKVVHNGFNEGGTSITASVTGK